MPQPISLEGLRKYHQMMETQRTETRNKLQSVAENLRRANTAYQQQTSELGKAQEQVVQDADEAFDNLNLISRLPGKIPQVLQLFDSKFNRQVQLNELERGSLALNQIGSRLKNAEQQRSMTVQATLQEAAVAESIMQMDRQGFLDQQALLQLGWQVEDRITQETARMAENASIDDLRQWSQDPSKAPKALQDKPGLVRLAFTQAMARELNVSMQELSVTGQQINIARAQREETLSRMTTNDLQNGFARPPEGISQEDLVAEVQRRQMRSIDTRQAQLHLQAGEMDMAQAIKQRTLTQLTSMSELQQLALASEENGGSINLEGMTYTSEEFRQAIMAKTLADFENQEKINQHVLATTGFEGLQTETAAYTQSMHNLLNPGVPYNPDNPMAGLPDDAQATLTTRMQQLEAMAQMGSPSGMVMVNQQLNEELKAQREEIINSLPEEVQPAAREYITNSDMPQIRTPQVAAEFLSANSANPMMLNYDPLFSGIWAEFSSELTRLQSENKNVNAEDMDIETAVIASLMGGESSRKDKNYVLTEQAIHNTALRDKAANAMFGKLMQDTVMELVSESQSEDTPWAGLFNAGSGRFNVAAYELSEDGQLMFSKDRWNDLLAQRTLVLHEKGTLPTDVTLMDVLYERMQTNLPRVRQYVQNDMTTAALNNVLFANRPENAVAQRLGEFSTQQERMAALEQARSELSQVGEVKRLETQAQQARSQATTKLARQGASSIEGRAERSLEQLSPTARELYEFMEKNSAPAGQ